MNRYLIDPKGEIFVKGYGFLYFAKNMRKNIGKNMSKSLSSKYSQKLLDHAKQTATDALKATSKTVVQKTAESAGDLIGNRIAVNITKSLKGLHHRIVERQLKMKQKILELIEKYQKKDIYLQKKDRKLLMI